MSTPVELRQAVLAVSVLYDVDIEISPLGFVLTGSPHVWISWAECRRALAGHDPASTGRRRLADWLQARRWAADIPAQALQERLRPVGLPVDHVLHPGLDWVQERVLGDALDLGLGAVDLDPADCERVVLLPPPVLEHAGLDRGAEWERARELLEHLGRLAAERARRDAKGQLRPMGDCDVLTLLGSSDLRRALSERSGGLSSAVIPMRRRGWTDLARIDPAFGAAAALATDPEDRGFPRPVLLTAEEVTVVPAGGRPQDLVLRDRTPAVADAWRRDVLYR